MSAAGQENLGVTPVREGFAFDVASLERWMAAEQLRQLFRDRTLSGVQELHGWKEGTFAFHPGDENEARRSPLAFAFDPERFDA